MSILDLSEDVQDDKTLALFTLVITSIAIALTIFAFIYWFYKDYMVKASNTERFMAAQANRQVPTRTAEAFFGRRR